jgi:hypothetical protein
MQFPRALLEQGFDVAKKIRPPKAGSIFPVEEGGWMHFFAASQPKSRISENTEAAYGWLIK